MSAVSTRVSVVSLGGTIATVPDADGRAGAVIGLSPQDLVAAVPPLADTGIALDLVDLRRLPGASVTVDDVRAAVQRARALVEGGAAGVVVTQGTDTIEETAFLLDLLWTDEAPIVVTGAMRYPGLAGADGPANLLAAVQVAASPQARDVGCLVVMSDEIHAARWVRKTHTVSPGAFASPTTGPVGRVVEGLPSIWWRRAGRLTPYTTVDSDVRVALVTVALDDDGGLLRAIDDRYAGAVVAGFGAGHVPDTMVDRLAKLAERIPVVLASRIGVGPVLSRTYGFAGSESDLQGRRLVGAGHLDPYKARLLLQVLLSAGAGRAEIAATFNAAGRG
jgi:L-asparaginase